MKNDVKALVEELFECGNHPCRVDTDFGHMHREAARILEAQQREIERLNDCEAELHGQLQRMIDRWESQRALLDDANDIIGRASRLVSDHCVNWHDRAKAFLAKQGRGG